MSGSKESLWNGGLGLALVTAALYCISTAYYGGFMGVLRLDADVLDRNFHQTLYHGFLTAFVPVFYVMSVMCVLLMLYSHLALPAVNDALRGNRRQQRKFLKIKQWMLGKRRDSAFERRQKRRTVWTCVLVFMGAAFIFFLAHFEREGKEKANRLLSRLERPTQEAAMVSVRIDGQLHRLLYLGCGARNCAGMDLSTHMVHYFPQNGHAFQHPQPAPESTQKVSEQITPPEPLQANPKRSALARSQ